MKQVPGTCFILSFYFLQVRGDGVSGAVSASVEGLIDHLAARAGDDFPVLVPSFLSHFMNPSTLSNRQT